MILLCNHFLIQLGTKKKNTMIQELSLSRIFFTKLLTNLSIGSISTNSPQQASTPLV
jgi:hypothetical protein